eukprot:scaffold539138_cov16-Prasinocladus_malaysianus.AAC.1
MASPTYEPLSRSQGTSRTGDIMAPSGTSTRTRSRLTIDHDHAIRSVRVLVQVVSSCTKLRSSSQPFLDNQAKSTNNGNFANMS